MPASLLRDPDAEKGDRVGFIELFFDLIFVFAATQLSHRLIERATLDGALETIVLFLAVWSVWTATTWVTNWLDVERNRVRFVLLALMIGGAFQTLAIPDAFSAGLDAKVFAIVHIAMQTGRALFVALATHGRHDRQHRHFLRALIWFGLAAPFWLLGAWSPGDERLAWWAVALAVEYGATAVRFWLPVLGGSGSADYHVQPSHFAERCGLFVIIVLGECILLTGSTVGELPSDAATVLALLTVLLSSMAMWWIYFSYSAEKGTEAVEDAENPGRAARTIYVYLHVPLILGVLVGAAGGEPLVKHPTDLAKAGEAALILGGPALFLLGENLVKRQVTGRWMTSHLSGLAALALLAPFATGLSLLALAGGATAVLIGVALWEELSIRATRRAEGRPVSHDAEKELEMAETA